MPEDSFNRWLNEILKTEDKEEQVKRIFVALMGWTMDDAIKWLNTPNGELSGKSPQAVMDEGTTGIDTIHDLMIDMVTGNPT